MGGEAGARSQAVPETRMSRDWERIREEFPSLKRFTYLNTATFGQTPQCAVRAMAEHMAHRDESACVDFLDWFTDHDRLRGKLAQLINCTADEIAFVQNASAGLALLMNGLKWEPGDEVVTLSGEFPNQIYAPAARGVKLIETEWVDFDRSLSKRTRLVALSTVNYTNGFRPPLEKVAQAARAAGALLYIDGTQSVGALRFDWQAIQPDLLAVNTYKWMLTPNGLAFLAVHPRLRRELEPQVVGWRSHHDWRNVNHLHHGPPVFKESAERYEGGMLPSVLCYALEAVVDLMLEMGVERTEERVMELAARASEVLRRHGGEVAHEGSQILAARFKDAEAGALALALKERGVLASARHGNLRISTHFYNNEADLGVLDAALRGIIV
jgi:cysteine desulfurase/selenocysteine lyase